MGLARQEYNQKAVELSEEILTAIQGMVYLLNENKQYTLLFELLGYLNNVTLEKAKSIAEKAQYEQ